MFIRQLVLPGTALGMNTQAVSEAQATTRLQCMDESEINENTLFEPFAASNLVSEPSARSSAADGLAGWFLSEAGPSYWLWRIFCVLVFGFVLAMGAMVQSLVGPMLAQQYNIDRATALQQLTSRQSQIPHCFGGSAAIAVVCIISMIQSKRMNWIQLVAMTAACAGLMYSVIYQENSEFIKRDLCVKLNLPPDSPKSPSGTITNQPKEEGGSQKRR